MSLDINAVLPTLKEIYDGQSVESVVNKTSPLLTKLSRNTKMGGKSYPLPVNYSLVQACSANFTVAAAKYNSTASQFVEFQMTRANIYSLAAITDDALRASASDMYAFVEARKFELDATLTTLGKRLATALYRQGWGELATIGSIGASTVTLTNPGDITTVEKGQNHQFASTVGGSLLRVGGPLTVQAVNRNTGVITYTAPTSTITSLTVGDYIFTDGDRQNSATPTRLFPVGLQAWCPSTGATPGESFFGVDRSVDTRLQGVVYDSTINSEALEDGLIGGLAHSAELGGEISDVFVSYRTFAKMSKTQRLNERYIVDKSVDEAMFGFASIKVLGPNGPVSVWCDQFCPANGMWGIDASKVELGSMGDACSILDEGDGLVMRADPNADQWLVRSAFKGNLLVHAPNAIMNVIITPV